MLNGQTQKPERIECATDNCIPVGIEDMFKQYMFKQPIFAEAQAPVGTTARECST